MGGAGGQGGTGGMGDVVPPTVMSTSPANLGTAIAADTPIVVTFSEAMNAATITTHSTSTCSGSIQVSADNFATCVPMAGVPTTTDDTTFTLTPSAPLASAATYRIRVTTAVEDAAMNALATTFDTGTGFEVRYARTITIDGVNDFGAENLVSSSTMNASLYFSYDDTNLYFGVESPDIVVGGSGNKFVYFLFSTDTTLMTGNAESSDNKAQFGTGGDLLSHHWKVRIDGADYTEYRIGNGTDWNTDWGAVGKSGARAAGYYEGSLALSELGSPSTVIVTSFTVDYDGDSGNGWLYNMILGATDGSAATPRDIFAFGQIPLPTSDDPNDLSHLVTF